MGFNSLKRRGAPGRVEAGSASRDELR